MAVAQPVTGATVTVTIRGLASGGAGVGELPDGRVVFADRTAPGDEAEVEVVEEKRSWARARLVRLHRPGPDRVDPPCPLYDRCGGCALQHLGYTAQRHWKGRIVADALERLGGFDGVEPPEVVPSPRELHYRDRLSFTLRRLRSGRVVAGFHQLHAAHRVLEVDDECLLGEPPLARTWSALRAVWGPGARRLPDGGRLRLTLRIVEGRAGHEGPGSGVPEAAPEEPRPMEAEAWPSWWTGERRGGAEAACWRTCRHWWTSGTGPIPTTRPDALPVRRGPSRARGCIPAPSPR